MKDKKKNLEQQRDVGKYTHTDTHTYIFPLGPHRTERVKKFSRAFINTLNPFTSTPPARHNHFPKAQLLNISTLGDGISTQKFFRDTFK